MATGIVKGEKLSADALLADSARTEPYPLPNPDDTISLTYPNKLTQAEVLKKVEHTYSHINSDGDCSAVEQIKPNAFLLADNFFGLKKLLENKENKITLIYFDPPYGTGLEFQSRGLKHAYKDILGAAPWLEFIRRRLILMRELLSDDGSIYVHIGHQMLFHLKVIMDEVFGSNRFLNLIVRKKCSSKNYTKNQYPNLNDYILFYSKNRNYKWNMPSVPAKEDWISKEYPKADFKGRYKLVPIHAPGVRKGETGKQWKGMNPPPGKHWQLIPAKLDELDAAGDIHWSKNGNPRRKVYLAENKMLPLTDYWDQYRDAHHQSIKITGYPTEKNIDMLRMIVQGSSDPNDIVLDPFCGSGTTLQAARDLNRRWIGIDQSFTAAEATLKRLRHGLEPMGDYVFEKNGKNKTAPCKIASLFGPNNTANQQHFNFIVDADVIQNHPQEIKILSSI
jgi:adenine-specific DNA-methyltransferase